MMAVLKKGDKGSKVKALQENLNKAGAKPKLAVTGRLDDETPDAVRSFQRGFPIFIVTIQTAGAERPDQARSCLGRGSMRRRQDLEGRNWRSGTANDDGSTCAGRTCPVAGVVCRRTVPCPSHAYAVSADGSRMPLIRPNTPAKACRGSAASANWKTA